MDHRLTSRPRRVLSCMKTISSRSNAVVRRGRIIFGEHLCFLQTNSAEKNKSTRREKFLSLRESRAGGCIGLSNVRCRASGSLRHQWWQIPEFRTQRHDFPATTEVEVVELLLQMLPTEDEHWRGEEATDVAGDKHEGYHANAEAEHEERGEE